MVVTTDGAKAYIVSNLPSVLVYNVTTGATSTIPLANGASGLSASATLDGTQLYVGGSDNNVHRIDTTAGTDAQQIPVGFTPDLVAVRPK
jgi:DNA-binding beta-propeller fold protein YncE